MYSAFEIILLFAVISQWTVRGESCSTGVLTNGTDSCCVNYYNDGISCKECPAGYYGINCSFKCLESYYGIGCVTKCECSPCHHIYGCSLITTGGAHFSIQSKFFETKIPVQKPTTYGPQKGTGKPVEAKSSINNIGQILIISTGSVISLVLITIILRETYIYRQFSAEAVVNSELGNIPVHEDN